MKIRMIFVLGLALALGACGVKNDLVMPNGKPTPKGQQDPSKPPQPISQ
jgi:predicted small lipoprotein YifL